MCLQELYSVLRITRRRCVCDTTRVRAINADSSTEISYSTVLYCRVYRTSYVNTYSVACIATINRVAIAIKNNIWRCYRKARAARCA